MGATKILGLFDKEDLKKKNYIFFDVSTFFLQIWRDLQDKRSCVDNLAYLGVKIAVLPWLSC